MEIASLLFMIFLYRVSSLVKGTKRTGIRLVVVMRPFFFSTRIRFCTMNWDPTGMTILPPSPSCSIRGGGMCSAAAVTTMAWKGAFPGNP